MGLVPKKSKAETKIHKSITMAKAIGFVMTIICAYAISQILCTSVLQFWFIVFMCIVYLILSSKAPSNKTQSFYRGLINWIKYLFSPKHIYGKNHIYVLKQKERIEQINEKKQKKQRKNQTS